MLDIANHKDFCLEQESPTNQKLLDATTGEVLDLVSELSFSHDLDVALEYHAAKQVYWEGVASAAVRAYKEFENVGYAIWMSYSRHYAKLALKGMGSEKVTISDIHDTVIRLFGNDAKESEKNTYARYAFFAQLCLDKGGARNAELFRKSDKYEAAFNDFKKEMYSYLGSNPPWTYEKVTAVLYNLEEQAEKLKSVARAFDKRSYSMKEFTDLEKAKFGNIGPLSIQEIVDEVTKKVNKKMGYEKIDERSLLEDMNRKG